MSPESHTNNTFQFPEVRVVEASAGSGKTYALAKRYIQLLFNPALKNEQIPIRQILAITFTNKAAFEMKERILQFLKCIAFGLLPADLEKDILHSIGLTQQEARSRASTIMEVLIRNYNFFQVQTIDKFINALLSGCAFKIGLTANFKIKTNSDDYLQFSLDDLIDRAPSDKTIRRVFEDFLHNYLYLENRTGWFPKKEMLKITAALFGHYNAYGLDFEEGPFLQEEIFRRKKHIIELVVEMVDKLPEGVNKTFQKSMQGFITKSTSGGFDTDIIGNFFAREFLPVNKGVTVEKDLEKLWQKIRQQLRQLCEEEAYSTFNPYIQIFSLVLSGIFAASTKDDVLFLSELNKKAGSLFDEAFVTVPELYYRLATRFRHYLIDEFQDTSKLQWRNLEEMAKEALSTGGSLFYVGDRKQAIYGFRGGDVALFDQIKREFEPFNVRTDLLTRNYRSQRAIVEFNNAVFSMENIKAMISQKQAADDKHETQRVLFNVEDLQAIENVFGGAHQSHRETFDGGCVKLEYVDIDKKEERDSFIKGRVLGLVSPLLERWQPKDIAILTRSNAEIEQVTNWLMESGIQADSERTSNVKENAIVKEVVALLRFLNSPIDNRAFAEFLLGDTLPKATGISAQQIQDFLFSLREEIAGRKDLTVYTEFRRRHEAVWNAYFNEFFQNVGLYPLYEMAVSLYSRFKLLEHFPQYQGYLMHFLELIKEAETDHPDLASFLEYYDELEGEELFVNIKDRNAVRLLTIHKSKGLEFPVVILPFFGMDVQVGASNDNQQKYILYRDETSMKLIRHRMQYLICSDELRAIYRSEYVRAFMGELNNAYVALTRAQRELYGFIPKKTGSSFNLAKYLIPENLYTCGAPSSGKPAAEKDKGLARKIPPSAYQDWLGFLKEEFQEREALRSRQQRLSGECAHFMLSFIKNLKTQEAAAVMKEAVAQAGAFYPHCDIAGIAGSLERLLKRKDLSAFFHLDDGVQLFCEKEIVDKHGLTKRIDRLIVDGNEVSIVDYKSAAEPTGKYQQQLLEYKSIVQGMYPKAKIRCYLIYLDNATYEEVQG